MVLQAGLDQGGALGGRTRRTGRHHPPSPGASREQIAAFLGGAAGPNISGSTGLRTRYTPDPTVEGEPAPES
jgi:hypothetical protein